jgi:hypothetical protein
MSKVIYVIQQFNCRGDKWEEKYSASQKEILEVLNKVLEKVINTSKNKYDVLNNEIEELEDSSTVPIINVIIGSALFCTCNDEELIENLQEAVKILEKGNGSFENEESVTGIGLTQKQAILNLVDLNYDDDVNW